MPSFNQNRCNIMPDMRLLNKHLRESLERSSKTATHGEFLDSSRTALPAATVHSGRAERQVASCASRVVRGPRQCLRVDIFPDPRQFTIMNGNVEDPVVLKWLIRGFDFPRSEAND